MGYNALQVEFQGHVGVVTLNRPDKLNAINGTLREETIAVFEELRGDDEVRAVVLTGAGRGFCSGVDLTGGGGPRPGGAAATAPAGERPAQSQASRLDELGWVGRQALTVFGFDKPTIAAVNGVAAGAGMSLALACDLRVGGPTTRFRTVFAERSLSPDSGMSYFLTRILGYARAADLVFTSRDVDGEEAYRLGLLDRFITDADLVEAAVAVADQIASLPPMAIRSAKRVLQHNMEVVLEDALRYETVGLSYARKAPNDQRESRASFVEKRKGAFTGT